MRKRAHRHSFIILIDIASVASISLLNEGELDTLTLRKRNQRFLALTNDHNIAQTSSEGVSTDISDVSDLVGTGMVLNVGEDTDTTDVITTVGHD